LLAAKASALAGGKNYVRDRSIVLLFLGGGASHIETFNPNMDGPEASRSLTGEVKTALAGVTFGGTFPQLAKLADRMAVVRSFRHSVGDHDAAHRHVLTGGTDPKGDGSTGFSIGSVYSRLRGASNPITGLPSYALLTQPEVDGQYSKEQERAIRGSTPGALGPGYAPFRNDVDLAGSGARSSTARTSSKAKVSKSGAILQGPGSVAEDMTLGLPQERMDDRRSLLQSLDRMRRDLDASGKLGASDQFERQAFDLILGSARQAFDLSKESAALLERYDTSRIKVGHKSFRPSMLGRQMLMARRLCEAGAGFVTVHSAGWDMHADGNNPGIVEGMNMLGTSLDKAVSAFIEDCESRGLAEKILLVITGDFGRTPKVNPRGGRDHWASLGTLAFAGGGLKMGQVVGASDRNNGEPATDPISPAMMLTTILHTVFDVGQLRVARGLPRELAALVQDGQPIKELF
jgi:hypothetical protein